MLLEALDASIANENLSLQMRTGVRHAKNLVLITLMEECFNAEIKDEITL